MFPKQKKKKVHDANNLIFRDRKRYVVSALKLFDRKLILFFKRVLRTLTTT